MVNKRVGDIVQGDKTGDMPLTDKVKNFILNIRSDKNHVMEMRKFAEERLDWKHTVKELAEREINEAERNPKKSDGLLCQRNKVKYLFIAQHKKTWPIDLMCRVLGVKRNGYYCFQPQQTLENFINHDNLSEGTY